MNALTSLKVGAAAAALAVDDQVLSRFAEQFGSDLVDFGALTVPLTLDGLGLTLRADGPFAANAIRTFLAQTPFLPAHDDALADVFFDFEAHPTELSTHAWCDRPLADVTVGLVGPWSRLSVYEALPRLGIAPAAVSRHEQALGTIRPVGIQRVDVGFDPAGLRVDVTSDRVAAAGTSADWGRQYRYAATQLGIPEAQAAYLGDLVAELGRERDVAMAVTLSLRPDGLEPRLAVTWAGAPMPLVLQLASDLTDAEAVGARFGALAGICETEHAWRLTVAVGGEKPQGRVAFRLDA